MSLLKLNAALSTSIITDKGHVITQWMPFTDCVHVWVPLLMFVMHVSKNSYPKE